MSDDLVCDDARDLAAQLEAARDSLKSEQEKVAAFKAQNAQLTQSNAMLTATVRVLAKMMP